MARSTKEAIAIVFDIGHSITNKGDVKSIYLENAKQCVSMIIKRKIFAQPKDEISLILVGTEDTDNALNYKNIKVMFPLSQSSWDMIKFLDEELEGTKVYADWLSGIVVGMDILKQQAMGKEFVEKKLVLFTDLKSSVSENKVDVIIKALTSEGFSFIVIGPDMIIKDETLEMSNGDADSKTKSQIAGEGILKRILQETGGVICNFEDAIPQLMYFQKKKVKPMPWNVVMDIGPDLKIAASMFKKTDPAKLPTWKEVYASDPDAPIEREVVFVRQDENQTVAEKADVIDGYHYGSTLVPYTADDKATMNYKSGEKCLSVLGFTKSEKVSRHLLCGGATYFLTAQRDDENAAQALSCLINAMKEQDLYAIVRKVYRKDTAPYLGVLIPKISSSYECLVYAELPFSEDMREYVFPPILTDKNKPSQQQLDAVDALIDNMDLTSVVNESGEKTEAFKPKMTVNPYLQHVYHSLSFRALNPDSEIPPARDDVLELLKCPFENKPSCKLAVEEVKKQFQLTEVQSKASRKATRDFFKTDVQDVKDDVKPGVVDMDVNDITVDELVQATVLEVSSVNPVDDFKLLVEQGEPFVRVCSQMQRVVQNLVIKSFGTDSFGKAETALTELRKACVDKDPSVYNDWIPKFRETLFERGKSEFWDIIVKGKLGLISCNESTKSSVSEEDARTFLEYEENKTEEAPQEEEMDEDDLLNQM